MTDYPFFAIDASSGAVTVSDGTELVYFDDAASFAQIESGFEMPAEVLGINYERLHGETLLIHRLSAGRVRVIAAENKAFRAAVREYDSYIAKLGEYKVTLAERAHPLYGVTDLAEVRSTAKGLVATEFEARAQAIVTGYGFTEQATWPQQLAEARAVVADADAAAPMLAAIITEGETKARLAAKIIAKADAMTAATQPLLAIKRRLFDAIDAANRRALQGYDAHVAWEAAKSEAS